MVGLRRREQLVIFKTGYGSPTCRNRASRKLHHPFETASGKVNSLKWVNSRTSTRRVRLDQ